MSARIGCLLLLLLLGLATNSSARAEQVVNTPESPSGDLVVQGISMGAGDDEPAILHILPWQEPDLPRRPVTTLDRRAPELLQPVSADALENHRTFRETLNPLVLEPTAPPLSRIHHTQPKTP